MSLFTEVRGKKVEFSEVRRSKLPRSGTYLLAEWGRAASRSPKRSALSTFVARIRCERLRLATAELPENFGTLRTSALRRSRKFVPSTVRGVPRGLAETLAEVFYPLPRSLPRRVYLRLFDALFAVGTVPEFPELLAGLGVQNGLHRFFDGLTTPVRPSLGLT